MRDDFPRTLRLDHEFDDMMTEQSIKLDESVFVKSISIQILEVYKSKVWNDTAISEISLKYNGKKYEIDLSSFNQFLKKVTREEVMK